MSALRRWFNRDHDHSSDTDDRWRRVDRAVEDSYERELRANDDDADERRWRQVDQDADDDRGARERYDDPELRY